MTHNLLVSFVIRDWVRQGTLVVAAIEELGRTVRVFGSTWFVSSSLTAVEAAQRVRDIMNSQDGLIVADLASNTMVTLNTDEHSHEFMSRYWSSAPGISRNLSDVQSNARNEDRGAVRHFVNASPLRVHNGRAPDRSACRRGAVRVSETEAADLDGGGRSQAGLRDGSVRP